MQGQEQFIFLSLNLIKCEEKHITGWSYIKGLIKDTLKNYLWQRTKRSPMILPIIMEV